MKILVGSAAAARTSFQVPCPRTRFTLRIPHQWEAACLGVLMAFSPLPGFSSAKVRIKPRIYIGIGLGRTLNAGHPAFSIEDQDDVDYEAINLTPIQRNFTRGQLRINLLHFGDFSLGYAFWAHYLEYPHDFIYFLPKERKSYPYSNHAGLHAVTVQWSPGFLSGRHAAPFLLGGWGRYYGNSKTIRYQSLDPEQAIYQYFTEQAIEDEGTAFLAGAGAVFFRYFYVYTGIVRFERTLLPTGNFLDLVVGFTI
jgi:hypothetical protein